MTNRSYIRESQHERDIIKSYVDIGFQGMRAAGSKGIIDDIVWNGEYFVFIASQSVPWDLRKVEAIWRSLLRPPNSFLYIVWKDETGEHRKDADIIAAEHEWDIKPPTEEFLKWVEEKHGENSKQPWNWFKVRHGLI